MFNLIIQHVACRGGRWSSNHYITMNTVEIAINHLISTRENALDFTSTMIHSFVMVKCDILSGALSWRIMLIHWVRHHFKQRIQSIFNYRCMNYSFCGKYKPYKSWKLKVRRIGQDEFLVERDCRHNYSYKHKCEDIDDIKMFSPFYHSSHEKLVSFGNNCLVDGGILGSYLVVLGWSPTIDIWLENSFTRLSLHGVFQWAPPT